MIISVDPGKSGAIAVRCSDQSLEVYPMPKTEDELVALVAELVESEPGATAYVERVGGFAGRGQPGSAMFTFGWWAAGPYFLLRAWAIRVVMVPPQVWMKTLGLPTTRTKLGAPAWKSLLHQEAIRRYPGIRFTKQTADALLLLDVAERGLLARA